MPDKRGAFAHLNPRIFVCRCSERPRHLPRRKAKAADYPFGRRLRQRHCATAALRVVNIGRMQHARQRLGFP
jgi:hypothetical protein